MQVEIYRKLRGKGRWSVRERGLVIHRGDMFILNNAQFVVRPAGRARVLRDKVKNVHAFVRGELVRNVPGPGWDLIENPDTLWEQIHYDPYAAAYFYRTRDQAPVFSAEYVHFDLGGVWAYKPVVLDTWAGAPVCEGRIT